MFTSDDLADSIVATYNSEPDVDDPWLIEFEAVNPPEIAEIEAEIDGWVVYVVPYAEGEESQDRGDMCREDLQCDVYVHGPVGDQITRAVGIGFVRQLRHRLRQTKYTKTNDDDSIAEFIWEKNETVNGIYDQDVLKNKRRFLSMFRTSYYDFA